MAPFKLHTGIEWGTDQSVSPQSTCLHRWRCCPMLTAAGAQVKAAYWPALERLLKEQTGATRVHVFDTQEVSW